MNTHIKTFETQISRRQMMIGAAGLSFAVALGGYADAAVIATERAGQAISPWVSIAADGTVSYTQPNQTAAQLAGQVQLANFQNPAGLNSIGRNLYTPTDASGDPTVGNPGGQEGLGTLLQGYVEQSNVSVVEEFINLIVAQRGYEANSKVVKAADDMYQQINNLTR